MAKRTRSRTLSRRNRSASNTPTVNNPALKQVDRLAWLLDNSIRIPIINYRIGLDAIIGLIPGFGDWAGAVISSYIVLQAVRLGAPSLVLRQMVVNVAIEALVGLIPGLGDIFDATFKANARNATLLRRVLTDLPPGQTVRPIVGRGVIAGVVIALLAIVIGIGWAGFALISWFISLFAG